ncbi:DUF6816 family protein [Myxacorys almedinensis]|uniref:DUF6816 domain-containing protein n=1 Tax=Myxacorys almedinensis A TaxID=2690445 RepID=A0A8J7Z315_9CYAN|nr:hypothetical protein [Myxacorys almedinensis]NDJ17198.1 hypothetical protein [Myxacorys almedinensis A]
MSRHTLCSIALAVLLFVLWIPIASAAPLRDRISSFPDWHSKPPVKPANQDIFYPDWLAGTWQVKSTLVDLVAPLAPSIVSPGFDSNRTYINQPVVFNVRFAKRNNSSSILSVLNVSKPISVVIADRAFNSLNIARAYLDDPSEPSNTDRTVLAVKVDPTSPNKQITLLRDGYQLTSTITGRATETPSSKEFITTEIVQQVFRGTAQPSLNQVETTTAYQHHPTPPTIDADQITAIYLSPQDPNYFKAGETPVALYRYRLEFYPSPPNP